MKREGGARAMVRAEEENFELVMMGSCESSHGLWRT